MSLILGIDPGSELSALVWLQRDCLIQFDTVPNDVALALLREPIGDDRISLSAVEAVQSHGHEIGKSVLDTVRWEGRFYGELERLVAAPVYVSRTHVKTWLCGSARAGDPQVRTALLQRFFRRGKPPAGFTSHAWAALAVALWRTNTRGETK